MSQAIQCTNIHLRVDLLSSEKEKGKEYFSFLYTPILLLENMQFKFYKVSLYGLKHLSSFFECVKLE
jgi:hypothetical protein